MSHTIITSCKDSGSKGDDTLIILVNSDGTLSVDPETLKKLLANQHQTSPISLVHLGDTKNADTNNEDDDDDADNRVNLTVEGYYPPTPAPSSPTPPPTPVADSNVSTDDMLHAGEDGMGDEAVHRQHGSVGLDHCYASLAAPQPPSATTSPGPTTTTTPTPVGHPAIRGTGRGRGRPRGTVQTKLTLPTGASLVPVVQQLVMPQSTVTLQSPFTNTTSQATAPLQRADNQVLSANLVPCTVMLNKVPMQSKPVAVAPISAGGGDGLSVKSAEAFGQVIPKKKGMGRGRVLTRGGIRSVPGRGRPVQRISSQDEAKNKQLADEMAATVQALALAEDVQFANIESMDQSSDSDRVIPLVNKLPAKKPLKVYRRSVDGIKTIKVLKPERPTPKLKTPRTSVSSESSNYEDKHGTEHKKEKVIVMPVEPQITPASLSALVMAQNSSQMSVTTSTPTPSPAPTPSLTMGKKYPKRENRKPPAHLAEAFGPALFSTPDIIRRVSTDKNPPHTPTTTAAAMAPAISATAKLEEELGLADQDGMMDTISSQVNRQEDQLLEEALLLEDLSSIPTDDILQDENPVTPDTEKVTAPDLQIANMSKKPKTQKQTSLAAFFPVIIQEKGEPVKESVKSTAVVGEAVQPAPTLGVRKLPPIELPATRGATKRASLQKETTQDVLVKSPEVVKKVANSSETRKSTDSKKSTESRKSTGRSESEDVSDDEGSPNDEDDPNRLWCICKRPHNNRFMICCDVCEDWFHGKCVGITKAMGEKMEEQEIDWMCPNCKKKKKQEEAGKQNSAKKVATPVEPVVETPPSTSKEKKAEASKVIVQQQKLVVVTQDTPKNTKGPEVRISKVARKSMDDKKSTEVREADTSKETAHNSTTSNVQEANVAGPGVDCIVCHKLALSGGVYCSDECIARHTSESLAVIDKSSVIVFEKKTGRIYSGPNMPTPSTLTSWLMAHPSYEVMRPGVLPTSKFYNQKPANPGPTRPPLRQTTLQPRPQGIQLIAALPQVPPIEVPPKKNQKTETPKNKPQPKGQQQITSLLKAQQAKQEAKVQQAKQELKVQQSKPEVKVQAKQEVKAQQIKQDVKKVQQAKQDVTEAKAAPNKGLTSPTPGIKPVKETKKALQVVKKVAPTQPKKVVREEREEGRSRETEEQTVRTSVKKTLQEVLSARLLDVSDIKLNEDQIRKIVTQIEEELYLLFKDTSTKYKAKYRSLMFNIKDVKNLTLFRKIADKSISPEQLVRLSPEELASQELAQWREQEARHQLEMIKKTELDMMQQAKTVVMKTHKGEQVVENDDGLGAKVLETSVEIEPLMAETPSVSIIVNKPKENKLILKISKHFKKDKKEDKHKERKHGHKSHHKSHDRSRSRHRHRSDSDRRSRSKSRKRPNSQPKSRSVSLEAPETKEKSLREGRSRSIHRNEDKERSKSKPPSVRERSKSRGRSTLSDRSKSTERARSKSMHRERSKSRPRERSKSRPRERSKSRPRERSKSRPREMSKSKPRGRSTSTDRTRSKSRARERSMSRPRKMSLDFEEASTPIETAIPSSSNVEEFEAIPLVKPQFYEEIREIVHDVVAEEESGANLEDDLSDHEPSSTVNISTPPLDENEGENESVKPSVWRGTLEMPDVAKFSTSIQEVSGICGDLAVDLPDTLDCVGRIGPEIAWDYIAKMKKSGTKQILVVRFTADTEEDEMSYLSFYSYLSTRNRLGVVGNNSKMIKDFYVLPLPSHSPVPQVLLPLDGPGFEDYRPHLLLGIIVRTRRKRTLTDKDIPFVPKIPKKSERSYTPPLPEEESHTPTQQHPDTESFTPPHSPKPPRIIKLKSSSRKATNSPTVSDDFVLEDGDTPYTPEDEDVPYSPGDGADEDTGRTPSPCSEELQRKVDKLQSMINKIEQEKQKIGNMATISGISSSEGIIMSRPEDEDDLEEAYSPSGSITPPPPGGTSYLDKNKISLPSDLQAIITSLKKKRDEPKSMDLKSDPIVQAYRSNDETFSPEPDELEPDEEGLIRTPPIEGMLPIQSVEKTSTTVPKINRDPRQRAQFSLSQISDEELLKKASEMGFMNPENPDPIPDNTKAREPPPPGLEEEYDPFNADTNEFQPPIVHQPPQPPMPMFTNQPFPPPPQTFNSEYPHPPIAPNFHPPGQFHPTPMFQAPPPLPPLPPPSHIPFTNPQPPPPQPIYPPPMPPAQPAPLPPPPPRESPERIRPSLTRKKLSKKLKKDKDKEHKSKDRVKSKKDRRRYSESPVKDYDSDKFEKSRDRDKYSSKKRERRDTWRTYDKETVPDKRREFREYETPVMSGPPIPHPPPPMGGPPPVFGMPGPMRGMPMRGRFQRGMRGIFRGRGFQGPPMRGFHRGGFHPRGHYPPVAGPPPPPAGPSRPINIQQEYEEDIRRFEEQRKQQKNLDRKRWRKELPPSSKKRRSKDDDSD